MNETETTQTNKVSHIESNNGTVTPVVREINVLVEEESLVRGVWAEYFKENNWPLEVFENPLDFLGQLDRFRGRSEKVRFYFDQDFGKVRGVGVEMAKAVKGLNLRQNVCLVTNYDESDFYKEIREGLLLAALNKYPEHIFGTKDYLGKQLKARPDLWRFFGGYSSEPSTFEKALNVNGFDICFSLEKHFPSLALKPTPILPSVHVPQSRAAEVEAQPLSIMKPSVFTRFYKYIARAFTPVNTSAVPKEFNACVKPDYLKDRLYDRWRNSSTLHSYHDIY